MQNNKNIDTSSEANWIRSLAEHGIIVKPLDNSNIMSLTESRPIKRKTQREKKHEAHGFKDVAGMEEQKKLIMESFINVIRNQKQAKEYNLTPPGILLYGPPGCGKTFFAEKVGEEAGVNFIRVNPDTIASHYVHGVQENVAELFKKAEKKAPTIIFFDEFDAMTPKRTNNDNLQQNGEVNEFLCMMNNASEKGIYIIAATNHPEYIDPSILRPGRIDERIYIGPPNKASREALFRLSLSKIPKSDSIDYCKLADVTNGFNCSDITYIVNIASRKMFNLCITQKNKSLLPVTQELLEEVISKRCPSINNHELREYERIYSEFSPKEHSITRRTIGFH